MGTTGGKRAGSRRAPRRKQPTVQPVLLLLALGVTVCVVAWGYLVLSAVEFGSTAQDGDVSAWWFLALASLGAVACLFVALMLVTRILRRLGLVGGADRLSDPPHAPEDLPRPPGGRRAAR